MQDLYRQNQALDLPALEAALKQEFDDTGSSPTQKCVRLILQSAEAFALDRRRRDSRARSKTGGRPIHRSANGFSDKERRDVYHRQERVLTNLIGLLSPFILFDDEPLKKNQRIKTGRLTNPHFSSRLSSPVIKSLSVIDPRIQGKAAQAFIGLTVSSLKTIRGAVAAARQEIRSTRGAQSIPKRQLHRLDDSLMAAFYTAFGSLPTVSMNDSFFRSFKATYAALNLHLDEESILNRAKKARQRSRQRIELDGKLKSR